MRKSIPSQHVTVVSSSSVVGVRRSKLGQEGIAIGLIDRADSLVSVHGAPFPRKDGSLSGIAEISPSAHSVRRLLYSSPGSNRRGARQHVTPLYLEASSITVLWL